MSDQEDDEGDVAFWVISLAPARRHRRHADVGRIDAGHLGERFLDRHPYVSGWSAIVTLMMSPLLDGAARSSPRCPNACFVEHGAACSGDTWPAGTS